MKDHNENCNTANAKNKEIIIADFLIKEWVDLINDYRRALGGKKSDTEDPIPLKPGEDKRGYLGGPEWGGLDENGPITKGGGFAICTQPVKYNRGVNPSSGAKLELCSAAHWDSYGHKCDGWENYESDHTSHWNCRHSMGLSCTTESKYNTSSQTRQFANLGTEMCFREGMPYESFYDGPGNSNQISAIGHSGGYRAFIRDKCGTKGCSPKKPTTGDLECKSVGSKNTTKYWGSQLLECGYNNAGIELRLLEFPKTRLGRGKFLDRISENANKIRGSEPNIITEDDILDYYISKLNGKYPNAKLTKENVKENTGPIKNAAGFPAEGVKDTVVPWNPDPKLINEILVDSEKSEQVDKLILPNCCSNTINLGDGSRAMLSDINQSCSIQSNEDDGEEQNNVVGGAPLGGGLPVGPTPVGDPPVGDGDDDKSKDEKDTTWDDIENWFKDENNRPIIGVVGGLLLLLILFLIFR